MPLNPLRKNSFTYTYHPKPVPTPAAYKQIGYSLQCPIGSENANADAEGSERREQFIGVSQWQSTIIREEDSFVPDTMAINDPVSTDARERSEGTVYKEQPSGYGIEPLCSGSNTHRQNFKSIHVALDLGSNDVRQAEDNIVQTPEKEDSDSDEEDFNNKTSKRISLLLVKLFQVIFLQRLF